MGSVRRLFGAGRAPPDPAQKSETRSSLLKPLTWESETRLQFNCALTGKRRYGMSVDTLGRITALQPHSIAAAAGIRVGDRIVQLNTVTFGTVEFSEFMAAFQQRQLHVIVGRPERVQLDGVDVWSTCGVELGQRPHGAVLVSQVRTGSAAARAGVRAGDQLVSIRAEEVSTVARARWLVMAAPPGPLALRMLRDTRSPNESDTRETSTSTEEPSSDQLHRAAASAAATASSSAAAASSSTAASPAGRRATATMAPGTASPEHRRFNGVSAMIASLSRSPSPLRPYRPPRRWTREQLRQKPSSMRQLQLDVGGADGVGAGAESRSLSRSLSRSPSRSPSRRHRSSAGFGMLRHLHALGPARFSILEAGNGQRLSGVEAGQAAGFTLGADAELSSERRHHQLEELATGARAALVHETMVPRKPPAPPSVRRLLLEAMLGCTSCDGMARELVEAVVDAFEADDSDSKAFGKECVRSGEVYERLTVITGECRR